MQIVNGRTRIQMDSLVFHNHNALLLQWASLVVNKPPAMQERQVWSLGWKDPLEMPRKWQATLVFLPGKSHGQRSLMGYSSQGRKRARHDFATKQQLLQ